MSLSAVHHAARQGRQSVTEVVATGLSGNCSQQYVPSVVRKPNYHLSPAKVDLCTVVNATARSNRMSNAANNQSS